jgi:hypothetical protein
MTNLDTVPEEVWNLIFLFVRRLNYWDRIDFIRNTLQVPFTSRLLFDTLDQTERCYCYTLMFRTPRPYLQILVGVSYSPHEPEGVPKHFVMTDSVFQPAISWWTIFEPNHSHTILQV